MDTSQVEPSPSQATRSATRQANSATRASLERVEASQEQLEDDAPLPPIDDTQDVSHATLRSSPAKRGRSSMAESRWTAGPPATAPVTVDQDDRHDLDVKLSEADARLYRRGKMGSAGSGAATCSGPRNTSDWIGWQVVLEAPNVY
ncbi:hypothetical protein C1H76_2688 [Elsinoe australis]|uniref:Uncharacterized protein n=1 Tax=Elsinoe australis TaxID=40998 RepID=A0A4V6DXF9_9PEZI|nr:hypothetical protein C1H76_2688 [Elsinoe australis]